jgi:hypothetical protein
VYAAGRSDIQVSEFSLAVTFTTVEEPQDSEEETPTAAEASQDVEVDEEEEESTSDTEDTAENQGNATDAVAGNSSTSGG